MAHEKRMISDPNNGNRRKSGKVKGHSDDVLGDSHNTIPIKKSSTNLEDRVLQPGGHSKKLGGHLEIVLH